MEWNIPGTVLPAPVDEAEQVQKNFESMFLGGGMVLSQVAAVTGLEPYTIQNWIKRGFLTKPVAKKYTLRQLCRIIIINMLKDALQMEQIVSLMTYINGHLDDDSDDLIDDSQLYCMFVRLAARARHIGGTEDWDEALAQTAADYHEPIPGAREKLIAVLRIMLTAWVASTLSEAAERMVAEL